VDLLVYDLLKYRRLCYNRTVVTERVHKSEHGQRNDADSARQGRE